jgi:alcohol dehydrogenase (cytochrome c)
MGYVYEMNGDTGKLIWKRPVGLQNGTEGDSQKALQHQLKLTMPYTISPGGLGGVLTNLALADGTVYVATLDVPLTYTSVNQPAASKPTGKIGGEVEALDLTTGKVEWDTKVSQVPIGAATVSDDLVFTTLENGTLLAFNRHTGKLVYRRKLPTTTNAPIAIAGRTIVIPAGGITGKSPSKDPQVVAYTLR